MKPYLVLMNDGKIFWIEAAEMPRIEDDTAYFVGSKTQVMLRWSAVQAVVETVNIGMAKHVHRMLEFGNSFPDDVLGPWTEEKDAK